MKISNSTIKSFLLIFILTFVGQSCKNKPTILEPITGDTSSNQWNIETSEEKVHEIVAEDILQASKYTYILANEDDKSFWIAVPKSDVSKGQTYYYKGGVKMKNFKSKDHDRVFEELYLVAGVRTSPDLSSPLTSNQQGASNQEIVPQDIAPAEGGISLKQLYADLQKYSAKTVVIKGQCVKVNRQIMGRNWIHVQDGSKDDGDELLDLTITTDAEVSVGSIVTMEGTITLNKDFGAGYRYEVIMEDAKIK